MHRKGRPFRNLLPNLLQRIRAAGHSVSSRASMVSGGNLGGGRASTAHNSGTMDTVSMLSMPASYSGGYYDAVTSETESMMTASTLEPPSWSPRGSCQYANIGRVVGEDEEEGDDREDMEGLVMDGTTPTNSLTPRASPLPRRPDFGDRVVGKVSRLESLRDTQRRMKTVTQLLPKFILEASFEEGDEDSKLGFANIPDQMHRKAVKKGFNFTLMIAGESGLGKSTLINSLFMQELYKDRESTAHEASEMIKSVTKIEKRQIELDERGVKLRLTIVDTPGFNDAVNAEDCWKPIEDYIDGTFEQYFKDECGLNRKNIQDNRVHCCLYFISPYGHGLRQVDVEFMRRLQNKVNIVPVIAKADGLTSSELRALKDRIMSDLDRYKIDIYRLPECDSDEEEEIKRLDKDIKAVLPFAVIGSNCVIESGEGGAAAAAGKRVRGRQYPWGTVEVENTKHCDFTKLRLFLLKTHMQDLKDMTLEVHYENYRAKYITERMSRRQTDRQATGVQRTDRENGPGFEAIVGADCLLRQKEDERVASRTMDAVSRVKTTEMTSTSANHNTPLGSSSSNAGNTPGGVVPRSVGAMAAPGTLPPKAGLSAL